MSLISQSLVETIKKLIQKLKKNYINFVVSELILNEIARIQKGKKHISNIKEKIVPFFSRLAF